MKLKLKACYIILQFRYVTFIKKGNFIRCFNEACKSALWLRRREPRLAFHFHILVISPGSISWLSHFEFPAALILWRKTAFGRIRRGRAAALWRRKTLVRTSRRAVIASLASSSPAFDFVVRTMQSFCSAQTCFSVRAQCFTKIFLLFHFYYCTSWLG
jgi:hypothetical protein